MLPEKILVSTAYIPPIEYISVISEADELLIEKEENYPKQTYRNRCYILSADGIQHLTVPVYQRSAHKILVKDIRIDYSKRWQQVHIGALRASYGSSPYFQYYFEEFEKAINLGYKFLIDLNMSLLTIIMRDLKISSTILFTENYLTPANKINDYRYSIFPGSVSDYKFKDYIQVFVQDKGFVQGLSIIDLVFNKGPEANGYL